MTTISTDGKILRISTELCIFLVIRGGKIVP